jgi:hypothetical protein
MRKLFLLNTQTQQEDKVLTTYHSLRCSILQSTELTKYRLADTDQSEQWGRMSLRERERVRWKLILHKQINRI